MSGRPHSRDLGVRRFFPLVGGAILATFALAAPAAAGPALWPAPGVPVFANPADDAVPPYELLPGEVRAQHVIERGTRRWPTRTITYYNSIKSQRYRDAVGAAARSWNESGVRIRFKEAPARRARLRIVRHRGDRKASRGNASLGYVPANVATRPDGESGPRVRGNAMWLTIEPDLPPFQAQLIVAHEFGHNLGLGHELRKCALMNPLLFLMCPDEETSPTEGWLGRCRVLEADDLRGALKLYGGRFVAPGPAVCEHTPAPTSPTNATASIAERSDSGAVIDVAWTPGARTAHTSYTVARDACLLESESASVLAMGSESRGIVDVPGPGRYCIALYAVDQYGRFAAPATVFVDVPEQAPQPDDEEPPAEAAARHQAPSVGVR